MSDAKRVVIFGSKGQLGVELVRVFGERGWDVTGLDRGQVDVGDAARVEQAVAGKDASLIVNAAAYNMVDVAESEPEAAFRVNALAVRNLALAARQLDAVLVHFSTDYVFDGAAGRAYTEEDRPHPLGAYAVSKYAGELYAQAYLEPLIIRTSGVFGPAGMGTARGNFVELMLRLAQQKQPIRVVEDHVASPTYAPALAERTADLVDQKLRGVFHVGGGTPISWFDYAAMIFEIAASSRNFGRRASASIERRPSAPNTRPCPTASWNGAASLRCPFCAPPCSRIWRFAIHPAHSLRYLSPKTHQA